MHIVADSVGYMLNTKEINYKINVAEKGETVTAKCLGMWKLDLINILP